MFNVDAENAADDDLGAGGPVVLPDMTDASGKTRRLAVGSGKDRNIYLVNREAMGKFNPQGNQNIYQELPKALKGERFRGAPAYFDRRLYFGSVNDSMREFRFIDARLRAEPVSITAAQFGYPGAIPSVSANGTSNGMVWASGNSSRRSYTPTMPATCERTVQQQRGRLMEGPLRARKQIHHAHDRSGKGLCWNNRRGGSFSVCCTILRDPKVINRERYERGCLLLVVDSNVFLRVGLWI